MTEKKTDTDRLSSVETSIFHLAESLKAMADENNRKFQEISNDIHELSRSGHTNWQTIAGWAAVSVAVVAYLGNLAISPIEKNQARIVEMVVKQADMFHSHTVDGHPRRVEQKTITNNEAIRRLEDWVLKREGIPDRLQALERAVFNERKNDGG